MGRALSNKAGVLTKNPKAQEAFILEEPVTPRPLL